MISESRSSVQLTDGRTVRLGTPPARLEDFTGQQFGDVTVLGYGRLKRFPAGFQHHVWVIRCSCGHLWEATTGNLRHGHVRRCLSCSRTRGNARYHGKSKTAEYRSWWMMRYRCSAPLNSGYPNYGGRGIRVCRQWCNSFAKFFEDMGPKPSPDHSIDRIDNDGPYSPENCRWATREQQASNKRHGNGPPRRFTIAGKTGNISQWARRLGISRERVRQRLLKYPPEVALMTPKGEQPTISA